MKSKDIIQQKYKKVSCSKCSSNKIKKDGKRKTQNRGKIQRYRYKECNFKFVIDNGFYRMRTNQNKITAGLDLYYKGVSLRKVQEHFQAFYPHNSSHMSIYRRIVKYAVMVSSLINNIPIKCGKEMQSDEMEYYRRKSKYHKGKEQNWFVDTIDVETKFMVTGEYMKSRTNEDLIRVMKRA